MQSSHEQAQTAAGGHDTRPDAADAEGGAWPPGLVSSPSPPAGSGRQCHCPPRSRRQRPVVSVRAGGALWCRHRQAVKTVPRGWRSGGSMRRNFFTGGAPGNVVWPAGRRPSPGHPAKRQRPGSGRDRCRRARRSTSIADRLPAAPSSARRRRVQRQRSGRRSPTANPSPPGPRRQRSDRRGSGRYAPRVPAGDRDRVPAGQAVVAIKDVGVGRQPEARVVAVPRWR